MASYLWRKYADYVYTKWERTILWDMIEPYRRPKSFTPLVTLYVAAFYTGVIGAAITEQLYKEKYWEDHPGHEVPLMKPMFYGGPWKVYRGEVPVIGPPKTYGLDLHVNYSSCKMEEVDVWCLIRTLLPIPPKV